MATSIITTMFACTFPDVSYVAAGGSDTTSSNSSGDAAIDDSPAFATGSSSTSSSGCTAAVPADCSCPGACALPNASSRCAGAMCVVDACASGYADCNHDRSDGCEVDLRHDDLDCGACGTPCMAPAHCKNGKCK